MHHFRSRFKWILLSSALLLALFAMSGIAPSAHAAPAVHMAPQISSHCGSLGNLIESDGIYAYGTRVGELDVYYNSSTGYNCAYTKSGGPAWGVAKYMAVGI